MKKSLVFRLTKMHKFVESSGILENTCLEVSDEKKIGFCKHTCKFFLKDNIELMIVFFANELSDLFSLN